MDFGLSSLVYRIVGDVLARRKNKQRQLNDHNQEVVRLRQRWNAEFKANLLVGEQTDVIVIDIRRVDVYRNIEASKRISPWFKARLVGTYYRGIQLGLG